MNIPDEIMLKLIEWQKTSSINDEYLQIKLDSLKLFMNQYSDDLLKKMFTRCNKYKHFNNGINSIIETMKAIINDDIITIKDATKLYNLSSSTIKRLIKKKKLKAFIKIGYQTRLLRRQCDNFLK